MKNYFAYNSDCGEQEAFETFEEAEAWLREFWKESASDGYDESTMDGGDFIAKITHRSEFVETDNKTNYCQIDCSVCEKDECEGEEWPYSNEFERVGRIELKEIESEENK